MRLAGPDPKSLSGIFQGGSLTAFFALDLLAELSEEDTRMPDVHITWLAGRTPDQKRKVAQRITQVLSEEAGASVEATHVVFVDVPHTDYAVGGVPHADRKPKS